MKKDSPFELTVSIADQSLSLRNDGEEIFSAPVSTGANGIGFENGSFQTPTGNFIVCEKIGEGAPPRTNFTGRLPRSIWKDDAGDDAILSRILRLDGLDEKNANTRERFIYFHGTNEEHLIGQPASHGCIRLKNDEMIALFDLCPLATRVTIL